MRRSSSFPLTWLLCVSLAAACVPEDDPERLPGSFGATCPAETCRDPLVCARDGRCRRIGDLGAVQEHRRCVESDQCAPGLICGVNGECLVETGGTAGDACSADGAPCRPDYLCAGDGTCKESGEPGTGQVGADCAEAGDGACIAGLACGSGDTCIDIDGPGPGDECLAEGTGCRSDLVCAGDGTCASPGSPGTSTAGEPCEGEGSCGRPLVCSQDGSCAEAGVGAGQGEPCGPPLRLPPGAPVPPGVPQPCSPELVCTYGDEPPLPGTCVEPGEPGTGGTGAACDAISDCRFGMICAYRHCIRPVLWGGADCSADDPTDPAVAFFEVPRGDEPLPEFYRLPFPNDVRRKNGRIDLSGHPDPSDVLPDGTIARFLAGLEERDGFGLTQTILFRFSALIEVESLRQPEGGQARVYLVDIDPDSPEYGERIHASWAYRSARRNYICGQWVGLAPLPSSVLRPTTTYAAIIRSEVRREVRGQEGEETTFEDLARAPDFVAVMAEEVPSDPDVAHAHAQYAPLRAYLDATEGIHRDDVLVAAVFTTDDPAAPMGSFRQAVRDLPPPSTDDLVGCGGDAPSPCAEEGDDRRGCPADDSDEFQHLQGTFPVTVFQEGTPPYLSEEDGGAIPFDADGMPIAQRDEAVCFSLTLPKGDPMPETGWPIVIYAHGTGGAYRGFVDSGIAEDLATVVDGEEVVARFAVFGWEQVMHGRRRNSEEDPDRLFFNLLNPQAARDNARQGAADLFSVVYFLENLSRSADDSPTGDPFHFDLSRIYFVGHSQGAITGSLAAPFETRVGGVVLSGVGGGLVLSLLEKTRPLNIPASVKLALGELSIDRYHPMLSMTGWYIDAADPVTHARYYFRQPPGEREPADLFQVIGLDDTYTPTSAHVYFARATGLHLAEPVIDEARALRTRRSLPVNENVRSGEHRVTAIAQQFSAAEGRDGHFALFDDEDARRRFAHFLGTLARDGSATLVE